MAIMLFALVGALLFLVLVLTMTRLAPSSNAAPNAETLRASELRALIDEAVAANTAELEARIERMEGGLRRLERADAPAERPA